MFQDNNPRSSFLKRVLVLLNHIGFMVVLNKSLKHSWIRRIFHSDVSWKSLFFTMYKTDQNILESFGNYTHLIILTNKLENDFWKETLLT